jgi:hypothetical protein
MSSAFLLFRIRSPFSSLTSTHFKLLIDQGSAQFLRLMREERFLRKTAYLFLQTFDVQ